MDKTEEIDATLRELEELSFNQLKEEVRETLQLSLDFGDGKYRDKGGQEELMLDLIQKVGRISEIADNWGFARALIKNQSKSRSTISFDNRIFPHLD